ncbi:hypothetical protein K933_06378 [Candidatus Halobonum tyrrellensis G22]|uniref:Thiamine-binding protein domain-containing protein n=1 Tax=Candidatus Halobonum tyrrellensis G22 TaxID=1324957 RepID=V4HFN0_9EURY|nr:hypothetical protein K933_06378 [Candidatus Halobonum tyrrellensis G22]
MTVIALLSVAPVVEGSMAAEVAKAVDALDAFDVTYETNPMGTVIEAESMEELMAAATAAHNAVDGDRVSTFLKIDDKRTSDRRASEKVDAVERELGRPARSADDGGSDDEETSGERADAASPSAPAPDPNRET